VQQTGYNRVFFAAPTPDKSINITTDNDGIPLNDHGTVEGLRIGQQRSPLTVSAFEKNISSNIKAVTKQKSSLH